MFTKLTTGHALSGQDELFPCKTYLLPALLRSQYFHMKEAVVTTSSLWNMSTTGPAYSNLVYLEQGVKMQTRGLQNTVENTWVCKFIPSYLQVFFVDKKHCSPLLRHNRTTLCFTIIFHTRIRHSSQRKILDWHQEVHARMNTYRLWCLTAAICRFNRFHAPLAGVTILLGSDLCLRQC